MAEAFRNITASGATPLAITDNLNFGNPENPEIMGQLVMCIKGIAEAAKKLRMPVVSGNVSLYNETNGEAILPTPTIGAVGILSNYKNRITMAPKNAQVLILIGETSEHLGQSALLDEVLNLAAGAAPQVDLKKELIAGQLIQNLNQRKLLQSVHDLSDGGLAVAAAEMALMGQVGIKLDDEKSLGWLFGEGQGRYLVSSRLDDQLKILDAAKKICVPAIKVGLVEGKHFKIGNNSIEITKLNSFYESGLNSIFD